MKWESDTDRTGVAFPAMWTHYQFAVVKRELTLKVLINRLIYVPYLIYGHKHMVVTENKMEL